MRNKLILGGLSALAALALACGGGPSVSTGDGDSKKAAADAPASPKAVAVGAALDVTSDSLTATYTLSKLERKPGTEYDKPKNGQHVLVFLKIQVTKGETFACGCNLSFVDSTGKVYEPTFTSYDNRPSMDSADLKSGQHTDGWIFFDVPKNAKGQIQLKIPALFSDSAYGYWKVG